MKNHENSGTIANINGHNLEDVVEKILINNGYTKIESKSFIAFSQVSEQAIYAKQVEIGTNIYKTIRKCDFILFHPEKFKKKLIIECKWQQSGGSVDEKYPFLILNIKKSCIDTIIILDGGGYRKGAEIWLKEQNLVLNCLLKVVNLSEFLQLANKNYFT